MQTTFLRTINAVIVMLLATSALAQQKLPVQKYTIGINVIHAEMAITEPQRERGLMNRKEMGQNEGMMFRFDRLGVPCMWMKNTLIPLSVAFIDSDGVILNIEEMSPQTENNHCAIKPAPYALEMNSGWFKRKGITPGAKIELMK